MPQTPAAPTEVYGNITTTPSGALIIEGSISVENFPATQPVSGSVSVANLPVTQPVSGSISVSNLPVTQPVSGTVAVSNFPAAQVTTPYQVSSVTLTATNVTTSPSVLIAAANSARRGFMIWNNSANSVYVGFTNPQTSAAPAQIIATFQSWIHMFPICYTGAIYAIRNAGSGNCVVWEF